MPRRDPVIDEKTGERWYGITTAARLLFGNVGPRTLQGWAVQGSTPWGMPLRVLCEPYNRPRRPTAPARQRLFRLVLHETTVLALADLALDNRLYGARVMLVSGWRNDEIQKDLCRPRGWTHSDLPKELIDLRARARALAKPEP